MGTTGNNEATPDEKANKEIDRYLKLMATWNDSAKETSKLAMAALFLPVFFMEKVTGISKNQKVTEILSGWHIACWILLVLSIGLSITYQWTVARLTQNAINRSYRVILFPRIQFWLMGVFLISGVLCFVYGAYIYRTTP